MSINFQFQSTGYGNVGISDPNVDNKNVDAQQGVNKPSTGQASDSITQSTLGLSVVAQAYVAPAGQPSIPEPPTSQYGQSGSFQFVAQNKSDSGTAAKEAAPNPNDVYAQSVSDQLAKMDPKTAARVQYVLENPGLDYKSLGKDFSKAAALAKTVETNATAEVKSECGLSVFTPPPPEPGATAKRLGEAQAEIFENLLGKQKKLTPEEKEQLEFAFLHPELNTDEQLSPKLQKLLKSLTEQTQKNFNGQKIIPKGAEAPPPGSEAFEAKMANKGGDAVEEFISQWAETCTPTPTQDEINYVRNSYYFPGSDIPEPKDANLPADMLQAMTKAAKEAASAAISKEFGAPEGWQPDTSTANFNSTLEGAFAVNFLQNMNNIAPPLTDAQKQQLLQMLGTPQENIPADIKALFNQIKNMSMDQVVEMFGIPPTVTVKTANLAAIAANINSEKFKQLQSQMNNAKEAMQIAMQYAQQMPNGPEKNSMMNISLKIAMALVRAQAYLYTIVALDSEAQNKLVLAKRDTELNKIEKEKKEAEKIRKQQEKQKTWGFVGIILCIFFFPLALFMGPIGLPLFALALVNCVQQYQGVETVFDKMLKAITSLLQMFLPDGLAKIFLAIFKVVAWPLLLMAGPMEFLNQLMSIPTDLVAGILMCCGMSETLAKEVAMFIVIAIEIIAMIVITVVTMGAGSELFALLPAQLASQGAVFAAEGSAVAASAAQACATAVSQAVAQGLVKATLSAIETAIQSAIKAGQNAIKIAESIVSKAQALVREATSKLVEARSVLKQADAALERAVQSGNQVAIRSAEQSKAAAETLVNVAEKALKSAEDALDAAKLMLQESKNFAQQAGDLASLAKAGAPVQELQAATTALQSTSGAMTAASETFSITVSQVELAAQVFIETTQGFEMASAQAASDGIKASFSSGMRGLMKEGGEFKVGLDNYLNSVVYSMTRTSEAMMGAAIKGIMAISVVYTLATTAQQMAKSIILGIIARLQALMEAEMLIAQAIIKLLQQVIDSLIDGMQNTTQSIKSIGKAIAEYNQQMIAASTMAA